MWVSKSEFLENLKKGVRILVHGNFCLFLRAGISGFPLTGICDGWIVVFRILSYAVFSANRAGPRQ